jgi:hypothetical protein
MAAQGNGSFPMNEANGQTGTPAGTPAGGAGNGGDRRGMTPHRGGDIRFQQVSYMLKMMHLTVLTIIPRNDDAGRVVRQATCEQIVQTTGLHAIFMKW